MAATSVGSSGATSELKRPTTFPLRSTRNFSKFHRTSGKAFGGGKPCSAAYSERWVCRSSLFAKRCGSSAVRRAYRGCFSGPVTVILEKRGKLTGYSVEQKVAISWSVPGSWLAKSFAGKPRTSKPRSLKRLYRVSSPVYWGVKPHLEATFTNSRTLPL